MQAGVAVVFAAQTPEIGEIFRWYRVLTTTSSETMNARSAQALLAAAARAGEVRNALELAKKHDSELVHARGLVGIAQGMLNITPGARWAKMLDLM